MQDLSGYLRHIGFGRSPAVDLATLREVVLCHALSIPFENLDALTGRRISLDPADVERKLLRQGRGGWCFEQNLLLGNALRAIGFPVVDLAARVVWGREADVVAPDEQVVVEEAPDRRGVGRVGKLVDDGSWETVALGPRAFREGVYLGRPGSRGVQQLVGEPDDLRSPTALVAKPHL